MSNRNFALTVLFKGVDGMSGAIRNIIGTSNSGSAALRKLSDEARAQSAALRMTRDSLASASGNVSQLMDAERRLEGQLERTNKEISLRRKLMANQARANATGDRLRGEGTAQMAVGAAIAAPMILAAKSAADFDNGMISIRQNAGLSAAETEKVKLNILAAAKSSMQMPSQMSQAMATLVNSGLGTDQASQMLNPIGRAATAWQADINDLAKASFSAIDNLKVPAGETARMLEIMAAAGKAGKIEIKDMGMYFAGLTGQASLLGQTGLGAVGDLSAALEVVGKTAGDASEGANNLKNLLMKIDSKEVQKNFKALGVDSHAMIEAAKKSGKSPIEAIIAATKKATGGDLSKINQIFTDQQAQMAVAALAQHTEEYLKVRDAAMNSVGSMDADYAMRAESAAGKWKKLMGSLENVSIVIGDKLLPRLIPLIDDAGKMLDAVGDWANKNPELTDTLVKGAMAVAAFNIVTGAAKVTFGNIVGPITAVANAYEWLTTSTKAASIISAINTAMATSWGVVTGFAAPYVTAMFSAAAATWAVAWPVLAVIAACVLVAAAIAGVIWAIMHWDKVQAWFAGVWDKIKNVFSSIDWLKLGGDIVSGIAKGLIFGIPGLMMAFGKLAASGVQWFKDKLGIKSPSRVFMGMGGHIAEGLNLGIRDNMHRPMKAAGAMAAGVAAAGMIGGASPALASGYGAGTAAAAPVVMHIHPGAIVIQGGNGSPQDIAAAVEEALRRVASQAQTNARAAYRDDDA